MSFKKALVISSGLCQPVGDKYLLLHVLDPSILVRLGYFLFVSIPLACTFWIEMQKCVSRSEDQCSAMH